MTNEAPQDTAQSATPREEADADRNRSGSPADASPPKTLTEEVRAWLFYKPFKSYFGCRWCGCTWWPDERPGHRLDCRAGDILKAVWYADDEIIKQPGLTYEDLARAQQNTPRSACEKGGYCLFDPPCVRCNRP